MKKFLLYKGHYFNSIHIFISSKVSYLSDLLAHFKPDKYGSNKMDKSNPIGLRSAVNDEEKADKTLNPETTGSIRDIPLE